MFRLRCSSSCSITKSTMSSALRSIVFRAYFIIIVINISSNGQYTSTTETLPREESSETERYKVIMHDDVISQRRDGDHKWHTIFQKR